MSGNNRQQKKPENILPVNEVTTQVKQQTYTPIFRKNTAKIEAYDPTTYKDSQSITDLIALGQQRRKDYEERYKKATKNTKALAWGNLLTQLGKLAGMGNAPVVKEDQTHLLNAFGEADRLRNAYYDIADRYDTAVLNARARERAAHEANWYARQKANFEAEQDYITALNKFEAEKAKNSVTTKTTKYNDDTNEKRKLAIAQQNADTAREKGKASQKVSNAKANYYNSGAGKGYKVTTQGNKESFLLMKEDIDSAYNQLLDIKNGIIPVNDKGNLDNDISAMINAITKNPDLKESEKQVLVERYMRTHPEWFPDITARTRISTAQSTQDVDDLFENKENVNNLFED